VVAPAASGEREHGQSDERAVHESDYALARTARNVLDT
jgi:hypothetical protein